MTARYAGVATPPVPPAPPVPQTPRVGAFRIAVSAKLLKWPPVCACCQRPADASLRAAYTRTTGKRVVRSQTRYWDVPYCSGCLRHVAHAQSGATLNAWGAFFSFAALGLLFCVPVPGAIISILLAAGAFSVAVHQHGQARAAMVSSCACPRAAVEYLGWDGSVQGFLFANGEYAELFRQANAAKVVG